MRARTHVIVLFLATPLLVGCSSPASPTPADHSDTGEPSFSGLVFFLTDAKSERQALGPFAASERREIPIRLENRTGHPLRWSTMKMSCGCLELRLPANHLGVGEWMDGVVFIDLSHAPDFRGGLVLTAEAVKTEGSPSVFSLVFLVDIGEGSLRRGGPALLSPPAQMPQEKP